MQKSKKLTRKEIAELEEEFIDRLAHILVEQVLEEEREINAAERKSNSRVQTNL